jgi:hypothetical protein
MPDTYTLARHDFVANIILDALLTQDAQTYHGEHTDIARLALDTAKKVQDQIRHGGFTA